MSRETKMSESSSSELRMSRGIKEIISFALSILFKITLYLSGLLLLVVLFFTYYFSMPIKTPQTLWIPQGSVTGIITHLSKNGYDLGKLDLYVIMKLGVPQSGWISMGAEELSRLDFLYKLTKGKAKVLTITLIPGETSEIFFDIVAKKLSLDSTKLYSEYQRLSPFQEAGIFADTYHVPLGIDETNLVEFLLESSQKQYTKYAKELLGKYEPKEWNRILTIASIIQKEAASVEEMPQVSSVIYNRLRKNMRLQMDGTLNYGRYSHIKITPERIKNDTSHYNTYKHRGLPPSPIGAVSPHAIKAAINPATTDYLYFMKNSQGTHDFSKDYKTHRGYIRKARDGE